MPLLCIAWVKIYSKTYSPPKSNSFFPKVKFYYPPPPKVKTYSPLQNQELFSPKVNAYFLPKSRFILPKSQGLFSPKVKAYSPPKSSQDSYSPTKLRFILPQSADVSSTRVNPYSLPKSTSTFPKVKTYSLPKSSSTLSQS